MFASLRTAVCGLALGRNTGCSGKSENVNRLKLINAGEFTTNIQACLGVVFIVLCSRGLLKWHYAILTAGGLLTHTKVLSVGLKTYEVPPDYGGNLIFILSVLDALLTETVTSTSPTQCDGICIMRMNMWNVFLQPRRVNDKKICNISHFSHHTTALSEKFVFRNSVQLPNIRWFSFPRAVLTLTFVIDKYSISGDVLVVSVMPLTYLSLSTLIDVVLPEKPKLKFINKVPNYKKAKKEMKRLRDIQGPTKGADKFTGKGQYGIVVSHMLWCNYSVLYCYLLAAFCYSFN